ncbi:16S rRNA (guanine966-N2)-methyltransferase [Actinocrispum wychmicini]|uniref:16S rRNA (Guanine966-N2)-methyltransferase n=1 Tax=Actinocrispum wychmicini TaxID=1213861 RepID=A0A4R2JS64_9PSEU|nr:16S rRNA (guanine966-N2)-methyltransferase [Actinocrispum wychmicini]
MAGTAGGRRLVVPPKGTRPTSERVREALFNALESAMDLDGADVLDLYAGSGALGLEALSRGATKVTFVESDRTALTVLRKNVAAIGIPGAEVVPGRVRTVLEAGTSSRYDVVLADPPYADEDVDAVLEALTAWTRPGAMVVVERSVRSADPVWPGPLQPLRVKKYGDTALHWARHPEE